MKTKQELVTEAEAILNISLIQVGNRYAYRADETDEWFWVTASDMRYAITLSKDDDEEIQTSLYSHWCASTGTRVSERTARKLDIEHGYATRTNCQSSK
jgi:hypothetical protein